MPATTRPDLTAAALASAAAAGLALAVRTSEPFDHGAWLVAYLFLVGFLAQLLLGLGQAALLSGAGASSPTPWVRLRQALLWNLGVVAVPAGVLAETRLAVVAGSLSLFAALTSLAKTTRPELTRAHSPRWLSWGYRVLLAAMLVSTLIGTALAWDIPWA
jgi:hypothetical protein